MSNDNPNVVGEVNLREQHSAIVSFFHCKRCFLELPTGQSMKDWSKLSCGWTKEGFQVWCDRHSLNIIHVDFEGVKHKTVP